MAKQFIAEQANIDLPPEAMDISNIEVMDISIGDLHGNALKLLYFLTRQSIVSLSDKHYTRMVEVYKTPATNVTSSLLAEFKGLIDSMEIINHCSLIRFIGDELGDRGANDYYVLEILRKLTQDKANIEILISNHGMEFIEGYERFHERNNTFGTTLMGKFAISLMMLGDIVSRGLIASDYIFDIINTCYKPHLKLISHTLDLKNSGITLFSHAGIDLNTVFLLTKKFDLEFNDKTPMGLALTINNLNQQFQLLVQKNQLHQLYNAKNIYVGFESSKLRADNAFEFVLWNRHYDRLQRMDKHNGYAMSYVHGHDSDDETRGNIYNLDNLLGKSALLHKHRYTVLVSDEVAL